LILVSALAGWITCQQDAFIEHEVPTTAAPAEAAKQ
jgi:hypothetical protein